MGACGGSAFTKPPAASYEVETHQFTFDDSTASLPGASVTKDFFPGTNAQPLLGRFFIDDDFVPRAPSTVVLSHQLWNDRLGASATIIGHTITIDDRRWVVVGIAPNGFEVPAGAQFWIAKR
ncbi:MAG TPA: ABC transporter permease [Vicinamibacterales bacterium]|nr:ABC transporter permease [Vicinamibacterales bacterium]